MISYSITDKGIELELLLNDELRKVEREIRSEGAMSSIDRDDPRVVGLKQINAAILALWYARLHHYKVVQDIGDFPEGTSIFSIVPQGSVTSEEVENSMDELVQGGYVVLRGSN